VTGHLFPPGWPFLRPRLRLDRRHAKGNVKAGPSLFPVAHALALPGDVAVAFPHEFLLGKSGGSKFVVKTPQKQSDAFVDHCLDNPNEKAVDAMMKVKS